LTEGATLAANVHGVRLAVSPVTDAAVIEVDREILTAVVMNVLQNAFKFTRPQTTVILRVATSAERVLIEIQDECGGLPRGDIDDLFRPFEQRGANRTGLGLGLAFSRLATEVNHGRLYVPNLPEVGCIFTVDLPRCPVRTLIPQEMLWSSSV
jgi:signal transduction histidine kinase